MKRVPFIVAIMIKDFCYMALFDIMINYYVQTTGAVFIPSGEFLDPDWRNKYGIY